MQSVTLKNGDWTAVVVPDFGADLVSLRHGGTPILLESMAEQELLSSPFVHGSPLLLPPNRTDGGAFLFQGTEYHLPLSEPSRCNNLHGELYHAPFSVVEKSSDRLTLRHEEDGSLYPFPCVLTRRFTLTKEGLLDEVTVENTGDGDMPFVLGFHTTFHDPSFVSLRRAEKWERDGRFLPTGRKILLDDADRALSSGCDPRGVKYSGCYPIGEHHAVVDGIRFTVSETFHEWVLFSGSGFFCAEPQSGMVNGLNRKDGHQELSPGGAWRCSMRYSLN